MKTNTYDQYLDWNKKHYISNWNFSELLPLFITAILVLVIYFQKKLDHSLSFSYLERWNVYFSLTLGCFEMKFVIKIWPETKTSLFLMVKFLTFIKLTWHQFLTINECLETEILYTFERNFIDNRTMESIQSKCLCDILVTEDRYKLHS